MSQTAPHPLLRCSAVIVSLVLLLFMSAQHPRVRLPWDTQPRERRLPVRHVDQAVVAGSRCPASGVTAWGHADGFGAQYAAMLSVFAWSLLHNLTYCTSPWVSMEHGADPTGMFRFVGGELFGPPALASTREMVSAHDALGCTVGVRRPRPCRYGQVPEARRLARLFYSNSAAKKPATLLFDPAEYNVAVHIRRGDVSRRRYPFRYTPNARYIECMHNLRYVLPRSAGGKRLRFHVFTDGTEQQLGSMVSAAPPDLNIHFNETARAAFHHLVVADALVVARSSFSWCAGFLRGKGVYTVQPEEERAFLLPGVVSCTNSTATKRPT